MTSLKDDKSFAVKNSTSLVKFKLETNLGKPSLKAKFKNITINEAKGILFQLFICNSLVLISINIKINKNKIETAPI
jgi:hypothetical protein